MEEAIKDMLAKRRFNYSPAGQNRVVSVAIPNAQFIFSESNSSSAGPAGVRKINTPERGENYIGVTVGSTIDSLLKEQVLEN